MKRLLKNRKPKKKNNGGLCGTDKNGRQILCFRNV